MSKNQNNADQVKSDHLWPQFKLIEGIRTFFRQENFLEVITPPMVTNPGMEIHIHPFEIFSAKDRRSTGNYLHTSPEFHMKELLSRHYSKIYTISYCFRNEPSSPQHRCQFLMLEWYRANDNYLSIMDDCQNLITFCIEHLKGLGISILPQLTPTNFARVTVKDLFLQEIGIDILDYLETNQLRQLIKKKFPDIPLPTFSASSKLEWDDYYFLLFLNKVEKNLSKYPFLLLYEFPHHLRALSTLKRNDPRVRERFEIYLNGMELCNCFNELTDIVEQKSRFQNDLKIEENLYSYTLPQPQILYDALERGIPPSAGVALGIERLLMSLTGTEQPFWK